jgi:N6-L-threonylcarbamoyladenine synthase
MLILGIESSCDETAAAVVEDGLRVRSSVVQSQIDLHRVYGGVVPELACRAHIESIHPLVVKALSEAGLGLREIDAFAVTSSPGLIGALLVGVSMAKSLALATGRPIVGVDHVEGHIYAVRMARPELKFPCVSLVVSGGHTSLYLSKSEIDHGRLGSTHDDAAGEAFDKVAKILGLGFPGGPAIDRLSRGRDPRKVAFKRTLPEGLDFSFSGIKTGVLYRVRGQDAKRPAALTPDEKADVAAGFQEAVVDMLVEQTMKAVERTWVASVAVGGGVACNSRLREKLGERAAKKGLACHFPPPEYCTDNAAMIAGLGWHLLKAGRASGLDLDASPTQGRQRP